MILKALKNPASEVTTRQLEMEIESQDVAELML
jgi:hypothetical protein